MRMGQGVRTAGLGHRGITCILQTQFSSLFLFLDTEIAKKPKTLEQNLDN